MKHTVTTAIVLTRTNYGEADRIVTILTPQGKVRLLAKGVRKIKSKLAGGVELFSVSEVTFLQGRGELQTLISSRLQEHFGNITKQIDRTMAAYELLKTINKVTEEQADGEYFNLLKVALASLDNIKIPLQLLQLWFTLRLLQLEGRDINLRTSENGQSLVPSKSYSFSYEQMCFVAGTGNFNENDIKFLRLISSLDNPDKANRVDGAEQLTNKMLPLVDSLIGQ